MNKAKLFVYMCIKNWTKKCPWYLPMPVIETEVFYTVSMFRKHLIKLRPPM